MKSLSIIVPVYNGESYVGRCLDSIISQGIPEDEYEIIVVNDGSTDKTCEILSSYERLCPSIRILNQENKGISGARNTGIKAAEGKYLWFVDSDDLILPNSIPLILNQLTRGGGMT